MTLPFENDTKTIIKRISSRNISANRKRNIFIIITIALASTLLSAITLYGFGITQKTKNLNKKTAQIVYHAISEKEGSELYKEREIAWIGEFFNAFSEEINHSTVNFTYANADMLKSQSMPYSGKLPTAEDEIVVQESFLDSLGYSTELGQTIKIPFSDGMNHDFRLTGILNVETGDIGRYTAIISKELVKQQYGNNTVIDYYLGLKDAQNMSEEDATEYADTLAKQLHIPDDNVIVRSTYFNVKSENSGSEMLFYFVIGFVTLIGSGIVIYSIFYISVASNIRNYGQLRTIGTTKRQIKKMVYREGKLLAAVGISIGLIIGNVIGYFLIPEGWYWPTSLCVTLGCGFFAFTMVMLSIHTPVKKAAAVSPMEALRYSDYKGKSKESSALYRKITPTSLAKMNLSRQKTKSILTIFSLAFGGVLVVLISTILVSYDGVAEARGRDFSKGEFNIHLNANQSFDTAKVSLTKLQQKNMLNENFVKTIKAIGGVTGIKPTYGTVSRYGLVAYASSLDQIGPVGKDVADCAALLEIIAGHDAKDSTSMKRENLDFSSSMTDKIVGMKFGVPKEYFSEGLNPEVKEAFMNTLKSLTEMGAVVEFFSMKTTEYMIPAYYIIASAEASSNLERFDGVKYGFRAKEYEGLHDMYKKTRTEGFGEEVKRRIMLGSFVLSSGYYDAYYLKALRTKALIKKEFDEAFSKYDVLLAPASPFTAPKLGESLKDPLAMYLGDIYTVAVNLCGLPGITVPCGKDAAGLPIGIQMIGDCFKENNLFRAAHAYEKKRGDFGTAMEGGEKA
mgnify:CR=1 FL=1